MSLEIKDLIYLPLDIPKLNLDRDKVLKYFDERKTIHQNIWKWVVIKSFNGEIDKNFTELFLFLENYLRMLPFVDFKNKLHIDIREQIVTVKPHHDPVTKTYSDDTYGPAAYKNMIIRDCLETFYVLPSSTNPDVVHYDHRPKEKLNPVFPKLPDDTDWFAVNNYGGCHGSFLAPKHLRKIIMFFSGPIDYKKHMELLEKSTKKYSEYLIYN